jgi:hypothetical protein
MRRISLGGSALVVMMFVCLASAQHSTPSAPSAADAGKTSPLYLRTRIALPGVYGRMDHYGWDTKRGVLIVSALGNDTVELIDSWKRVRTINGFDHQRQDQVRHAEIK